MSSPKRVVCTTIRDKVKERCNLPSLSSATKPSLTYVNSVIVQAFDQLCTKLKNGFGDDWFVRSEEITLQANTNDLDIINDFTQPVARLKKVAWVRAADQVVDVRRANRGEVFVRGSTPVSWDGYATPMYRATGDSIVFYPTPASDVLLFFQYSTGLTIADDLSTTITLYPGWEEWVINEACRVIKVGLDQSSNNFVAGRDDAWENIVRDNESKDEWQAPQVRDVYEGGWPGEVRQSYIRGWTGR